MSSSAFKLAPVDAQSAEILAASGLRLGLVDSDDSAAFSRWRQVESRGFHMAEQSAETLEADRQGVGYRRITGVWDNVDDTAPVGTAASWPNPLTVPGGRAIESWAISDVTVSPTHRRKGIARALLEAELRTAASLGVPMAMLTVSESTIYGRFGFAPAVASTNLTINSHRAKWTGPATSGSLRFVPLDEMVDQAAALFERSRLSSPGEIVVWDARWKQMLGQQGDDKESAKNVRAVRFDDADGVAQGFALYVVKGVDGDFAEHSLDVNYLCAVTDEAYAALWRYLLEVDLVREVRAGLRSVDEPLLWQVSDVRGVKVEWHDHLWLRVLDVAATLEARAYSAPGQVVFEVSDSLGFAEGRFLLEVDADGNGSVAEFDGRVPDGAAAVSLSVNELSAIYLGGITAHSLARAGRIRELSPGAADAVDAAFRSPRTPWLSVWF